MHVADPVAPVSEPDAGEANPPRRRVRWWRGITGSLAMGLAALAVFVGGAEAVATTASDSAGSGPGVTSVLLHAVAALAALGTQWVADRRRGLVAGSAGVVVVGIVAAVLWFLWYS